MIWKLVAQENTVKITTLGIGESVGEAQHMNNDTSSDMVVGDGVINTLYVLVGIPYFVCQHPLFDKCYTLFKGHKTDLQIPINLLTIQCLHFGHANLHRIANKVIFPTQSPSIDILGPYSLGKQRHFF